MFKAGPIITFDIERGGNAFLRWVFCLAVGLTMASARFCAFRIAVFATWERPIAPDPAPGFQPLRLQSDGAAA